MNEPSHRTLGPGEHITMQYSADRCRDQRVLYAIQTVTDVLPSCQSLVMVAVTAKVTAVVAVTADVTNNVTVAVMMAVMTTAKMTNAREDKTHVVCSNIYYA
eukprot:TRINITY_DN2991_c0_g1_i2.p1 TRINITY_DN2991_c0_g1~~TRINITY_DN2991_c0_g1_i2.p1  ORF type:complete len:102 (+),score=4.53 TRINITY_DN2991_c0_g1_i2:94-399(+)